MLKVLFHLIMVAVLGPIWLIVLFISYVTKKWLEGIMNGLFLVLFVLINSIITSGLVVFSLILIDSLL